MKKAFTLLELLIAISIGTIFIAYIFYLISTETKGLYLTEEKWAAYNAYLSIFKNENATKELLKSLNSTRTIEKNIPPFIIKLSQISYYPFSANHLLTIKDAKNNSFTKEIITSNKIQKISIPIINIKIWKKEKLILNFFTTYKNLQTSYMTRNSHHKNPFSIFQKSLSPPNIPLLFKIRH